MKIFKEILARIFALWGIIVFAGTMLIIVIPIWALGLLPEPKRTIWVFKIFNVWMGLFFILTGVRRIITGKKNFKKGENYVVVCNHSSFMDIPLSSPGIPGANKTIAKIEMARIPLFGIVYKRGSVLVDRKSEESRRSSFIKMKEVLDMGLHMCIYPEGTRNKTKEPLQRFHDGAFKLAVGSGKKIIPAVILNTTKVLPRKLFYFWPHPVEMHFLPAVAVEGKTVHQVKDEVFRLMKEEIVRRRRES
ncbi:MAG: lysophospholipid acyltransferase family protein [Flavisolibacter sp.]